MFLYRRVCLKLCWAALPFALGMGTPAPASETPPPGIEDARAELQRIEARIESLREAIDGARLRQTELTKRVDAISAAVSRLQDPSLNLETENAPPAEPVDPAGAEFFEKKIRPLMAENCFQCHGPEKQKSGLRLDSLASMLRGSDRGPVIVKGEPKQSLLLEVVGYQNLDLQMPPDSKLPDAAIADLEAWIAMGAPWPDVEALPTASPAIETRGMDFRKRSEFWSFRPLHRPDPPPVENASWVRSPIDRFILARLEEADLSPAPPADKRTLLRRVTYDLVGLPPTAGEIEDFLNDDDPEAFENVVERLLASPHYGERWGRHWLDLVRFAETDGHEYDPDKPNAYRYRDYVVRAFNDDLPYDQFVTEHVAGDLLPTPRLSSDGSTVESVLGTGFYWLGDVINSPVDSIEAAANRVDNQIDVFGKAFLGLTIACARCHDHKFDPIRTRDYYALAGFMHSIRVRQTEIESSSRIESRRKTMAELARIDRESALLLARPLIDSMRDDLLAAHEILDRGETQERDGDHDEDIVFEDFEKGQYGSWIVEGEAFQSAPVRRGEIVHDDEVTGFSGEGYVDSKLANSDKAKGRLISRPFRIERNFITFLIAGGDHAGRTCVNLRVGDRTVRTATGERTEKLKPKRFDVRELIGKIATLEIVDDESESWGHVFADRFVFTQDGETDARLIRSFAQERDLDFPLLMRWVIAMDEAREDRASALHPWAALDGSSPDEVDRQTADAAQPDAEEPQEELYEDFMPGHEREWIAAGPAFQAEPVLRPISPRRALSGDPLGRDGGAGYLSSGLVSDVPEGKIISPIFVSKHRYIHFRAAGKGKVTLVTDEYRANRSQVDSPDRFRWHTMDLRMYIGKFNYLKIDDNDPASHIIMDQIVFSDRSEAPLGFNRPDARRPSLSLPDFFTASETPSPENLADRYRDRALRALGLEVTGSETGASSPSVNAGPWPAWILSLLGAVASDSEAGRLLDLETQTRLFDLKKRREALEARIGKPIYGLSMTDVAPHNTRVHIRGNHKNLGEEVPRRFLEVFDGVDPLAVGDASGRLELARHLTASSDPLLPRVMVNRLWFHHFGRGIVASVDNFGRMGNPPSHPELLDFLATEFIQSGWSIKQMHRLMVLSSAYRMSSRPEPKADRMDPNNALVHRMPMRRLDAEIIHDAILAVSGRLDAKIGGPSVPPYLSPYMDGRGRPENSGPLDGDGRRGLYINVRRNFMTPMFLAFDFPIPGSTVGRRNVSNVPAQALTMMNNEFIIEQAAHWADRLLADADKNDRQRVGEMYLTAFGRPPDDEEVRAATQFLTAQAGKYGDGGARLAWNDLCHVLFNVTEFVFVN